MNAALEKIAKRAQAAAAERIEQAEVALAIRRLNEIDRQHRELDEVEKALAKERAELEAAPHPGPLPWGEGDTTKAMNF